MMKVIFTFLISAILAIPAFANAPNFDDKIDLGVTYFSMGGTGYTGAGIYSEFVDAVGFFRKQSDNDPESIQNDISTLGGAAVLKAKIGERLYFGIGGYYGQTTGQIAGLELDDTGGYGVLVQTQYFLSNNVLICAMYVPYSVEKVNFKDSGSATYEVTTLGGQVGVGVTFLLRFGDGLSSEDRRLFEEWKRQKNTVPATTDR